jgi:hypothetical protein
MSQVPPTSRLPSVGVRSESASVAAGFYKWELAALLVLPASLLAAEPSFPAVDSEPLGNVPKDAVVLHEAWRMRESVLAGNDGAAISRVGFKTAGWYDTSVPATALGVLVRHGIYPDPYIGTNNMLIPDASDDHNQRLKLGRYSHLPDKSNPWAKPYWFRKEFRLPTNYRGQKVWLHLDGLNYRADVWLNGQKIADAKDVAGMFKRFRFEVSAFVKDEGINALAVLIHPLDHPGDPLHEQLDGLAGDFGPNGGDGEILRNVTEYCAIGWDWVPAVRDRNMGLWQHVWLEATGPVVVGDPAAFTDVRLPDATEAALTVRCQLDNATKVEQAVELVVDITPDGFAGARVETRTKVVLGPNQVTEVILKAPEHPTLVLTNPRLWWPVTYGEQPLYRLRVEARVKGQSSSVATSQFGARTVGSWVLPSGGRAFSVNGRTIRMTGGAWVPDYMMSWSARRYREEVRLMAEGNHTVVRVNGCGIVAPEVFFAECDRRGVLVWQDLSRTSIQGFKFRKDGKDGWGPVDCDEPALYLDNMRDCILRLRGHPSLLVWCGSNEKYPQENVGRPLQNDMLPALDGTRPWLASSDENPPWRKEETRVWSGGPYHLVRLPEYFSLYAKDPKFTARNEIGLASLPPINSIAKTVPDHDQPDPRSFPLNQTLGYHDATGKHYRNGDMIARQDIGEPACLTEYLWMGDLYNNVSYRGIFEAANKNRPRNSGTHLWKVNAAWPSMMWQVFDWHLRPNAGYYSMRSACHPLHIQHSVDDQTIQVVSTLAAPRQVRVVLTLTDAAGRLEHSDEHTLTALADATTAVGTLPDSVNDGRLRFLAMEMFDPSGRSLERVVTWVQRDCRWQELLMLPPSGIEVKVIGRTALAEETLYTVSLRNTSSVPAVQVWLEVIRGLQGEEVLPSFWSDNAVTLLPSENRELSVRFRTKQLGGESPHLMVEGWNLSPLEWSLPKGNAIALRMQITGCEVSAEGANGRVHFTATQKGPAGSRWTTWPVPVRVDGQLARYVRIGLKQGQTSRATLKLSNLAAGEHRIAVDGGPEKSIKISNAKH